MRHTPLATFLVAALLASTAWLTTTAAQTDRQAEAQLQSAWNKAFVDGDTKGAIEIYRKIADGSNRAAAAKALVEMGRLYEKLGSAEAQKAYQQVVRQYADQRDALAEAETRLEVLTASTSTPVFRPMGLTRICSGSCYWDAVSPDGRYLLGLNGLRDLLTGKDRPGNGDGARESHVFSPDGRQIAYAIDPGDGDVYEMRVSSFDASKDTTGRVLLRNPEFNYNVPFGWSGDDVFVLLLRKDDTSSIAAVSVASGSLRIIKSLEWRWPNKVSLSPDGRYIVYDAPLARESPANPANRDIFILAVDGSSETPLVQDSSRDTSPVWTPDGNAVVFTSDRNGTLGLWMVQVARGKPQGAPGLLRRLENDLWPIGFARNGGFYYSVDRTSESDVSTAEINFSSGTVLRPVSRAIDLFPGRNSDPAFSPDGKSLAYLSRRSVSGGFLSIVIRSLETGVEREIPTAFTGSNGLTWFPDGQSLLFSANTDGNGGGRVHRIDLSTGEDLIKQLPEAGEARYATASPDGKRIYYVTFDTEPGHATLSSYELEFQRTTPLFKGPFLPFNRGHVLSVSPDGRQIATTLFRGEAPTALTAPGGLSGGGGATLRIVPTDGSPSRLLHHPNTQRLSVIQWSLDAKNVLSGARAHCRWPRLRLGCGQSILQVSPRQLAWCG